MGATSSKPVRTAPARFVAKQLPRAQGDVLEEFRKAQHTLQGINKSKEHVNVQPEPYLEIKTDVSSTQQTDLIAPRWYINAWMEMVDNAREDRTVITGNTPVSWERDKFEPYDLVRNRIDDEDLDWLLSDDVRNQPLEVLVGQTKLERQVLEDILATVEAPRRQFRNYQGKLHKAIDDPNTFLKERKEKIQSSREDELLRDIGYTDEEVQDDRQYRTSRSRGVKTLDQLGASIREKKRQDRADQHGEMQAMLEQRRMDMIEAGTYTPSHEELDRDADQLSFVGDGNYKAKVNKAKDVYKLDMGHNRIAMSKMNWWMNRRRDTPHGPDKIEGVPTFNERFTQTCDQLQQDMEEASAYSKSLHQAQGAKNWHDPRGEYDAVLEAVRDYQQEKDKEAQSGSGALYPPPPRKAPLKSRPEATLPDLSQPVYDETHVDSQHLWPKKQPVDNQKPSSAAADPPKNNE